MAGTSGIGTILASAGALTPAAQPLPRLGTPVQTGQTSPQPAARTGTPPDKVTLQTGKAPAKPAAPEELIKPLPKELVAKVLNKLNMSTNLFAIGMDIRFDNITGWYKVTVRNNETGKVIREIPPWDITEILLYIRDQVGKQFDRVV